MYCRHCGKQMSERALVCLKCGKFVSEYAKEEYERNMQSAGRSSIQELPAEPVNGTKDVVEESYKKEEVTYRYSKNRLSLFALWVFLAGILSYLCFYVEIIRRTLTRYEYLCINSIGILISVFACVGAIVILAREKARKINAIFAFISLGLVITNLLIKLYLVITTTNIIF